MGVADGTDALALRRGQGRVVVEMERGAIGVAIDEPPFRLAATRGHGWAAGKGRATDWGNVVRDEERPEPLRKPQPGAAIPAGCPCPAALVRVAGVLWTAPRRDQSRTPGYCTRTEERGWHYFLG